MIANVNIFFVSYDKFNTTRIYVIMNEAGHHISISLFDSAYKKK